MFLAEIYKLIIKFMSAFKGPRVANEILKKMIKIGGPIFPDINTYLEIKVIKIVCFVKLI